MEETNKKPIVAIIVIVVLLLAALVGGIFYFKKGKTTNQPAAQPVQKNQDESKEAPQKAGDKMDKSLSETTKFLGVVRGMQKPKDGAVIFLEVDASIIDKDKAKDLDYSAGTVEMPMIKKKFRVAVSDQTKLNVKGIDSIQLGDFVNVTSPRSIYETDFFTAVEVEVMPKNIK